MFGKTKKKSQKQLDELCYEVDIFIQVHFVREHNNDRYKFNTLILKDDPKRQKLQEFLAENNNPESFSELCMLFLKKSGKDETYISDKAYLEKGYFTNIRNSDSFLPTKSEAVALCLAMKLNIEEARILLRSAGHALKNSEKSDLTIRYFIENDLYNIDELNYVLDKLCDTKLEKIQ